MYPLQNWLLVALGIGLGSLGSLCMKWGAGKLPQQWEGGLPGLVWQVLMNPLIMAGIFLYAVPAAIWIWLLRTMPLTVLQPALSLTYVLSALLAVFILHEPVPFIRWVGIFIIIGGVILVARN